LLSNNNNLCDLPRNGKKHREMQAFRITRRNGFIRGRLNSKRSADKPSGPGADLEFNKRAAVSNSQSEMTGGVSSRERERADQAVASISA
jgi:hypothetical protein